MNPAYDFHARVAVVTGAGSGMGLATARAFAESRAAVVLADSDEQTLGTAAAELTSAGRQALRVVCDVSDEEQLAALVDRAVATFGRLDFAFNNVNCSSLGGLVGLPGRVALQSRSQLRDRRRAPPRRRLHRPLNHDQA